MPAKGKHRRPKSRSVARGFAVAGTGGAALALPLLGAVGAQAAGAPAVAPAAAPVQAPQVPAALQAAPAAAAQSAPAVYTVVPGDYLSKIAQDRHLSGGWQQLYADNREAVGTNPSLIHPGLKLTLGAQGEAAPAAQAPAEKSAPAPAKKSSASPSQDKGSADVAPAPAAPAPAAAAAAAPAKKSTAAKSAAGTVSAAGFVAPVGGGISTQYKTPGAMWSSGYHTGVDFIASSGTTVRAVGAGTVVSAGWAARTATRSSSGTRTASTPSTATCPSSPSRPARASPAARPSASPAPPATRPARTCTSRSAPGRPTARTSTR